MLLELLDNYRKFTELGVKMGFTVAVKVFRDNPAERDALLKRSYDLGEQREQMLLAHRDWAGPDEGMHAFTNDIDTRQWHGAVKKALGIEKPTALIARNRASPTTTVRHGNSAQTPRITRASRRSSRGTATCCS